uniref:cellulase n=1 Tax=Meloidogyne javanica TaxID=6303 RepID=A0A915N2P9_MELJA
MWIIYGYRILEKSFSNKLLGSNGQPAQLAGMSLFWSNCDEGKIFYNEETLRQLKCAWNANAVRAAMGVESSGCQRPGYLDLPNVERDKVEAVVQAAIKLDMYAVVDYHTDQAQNSLDKAKEFFTYFASKYGNYSNIIYEPFNEPTTDWKTAKAYHEQIVATIRKYDKNNMITLGTSTWSQDVDIASRDPVNGANLCYTLHIYAATHKQNIRDKAQAALDNNVCIFVSEYGTVDASGSGNMDTGSMNECNKGEGSAALNPNTVASDVGNPSHWSASGKFVQAHLKNMNNGVSCDGNKGKYPSGDDIIITTKSPSKNKYPSGDEVPSTRSPNNNNYPSGNNIILTTKSPSNGNNNNGKYPSAPSNNNSNGKYPSGDQVITTKSPSKTNNGKNPSAPSNDNNNGKYPSGDNLIITTKSPSNNNKYPSGPSKDNNNGKSPSAPSKDNNNGKYPSGDNIIITTKSPSKNKYPSGDDVPATKSPSKNNNGKYPSGDNIIITTKSPSNNNKYPSAPSNNNNGKYPSGDNVILTTKSPSNDNKYPSAPSGPSNDNNDGECPSEDDIIITTKLPSDNNKYPSGPSNNNNKYPAGGQVTTIQSPSNDNNGNSSHGSEGQCSISLTVEENGSWVSGANFRLVFKNNGNVKACALKFDLILNSGQTIQSIWNVQKISGDTYVLPDYVIIQGGNSFTGAGLVVNGPATLPQIKVVGQGECKY